MQEKEELEFSNAYVMRENCLSLLRTIKPQYEKANGSLDTRPWFYQSPKLGYINYPLRKEQIDLLEKFLLVLDDNLREENKYGKNEQVYEYKLSCKVILTVALYLYNEVKDSYNSELAKLLQKALGYADGCPPMSEKEERACFEAFSAFSSNPEKLYKANMKLRKEGREPFSTAELEKIVEFMKGNKDYFLNSFLQWPFTTVFERSLGFVGQTVGLTVGLISGELAAMSTYTMGTQHSAARYLGKLIVFVGAGSAMGVPFVTPVIVSHVMRYYLESLCGLSIKEIGGAAGWYAGMAIGMPADYLLHATIRLGMAVFGWQNEQEAKLMLSGLRIIDDEFVTNGQVTLALEEMPEGAIQIFDHADGLLVNGRQLKSREELDAMIPLVIEDVKMNLPASADLTYQPLPQATA